MRSYSHLKIFFQIHTKCELANARKLSSIYKCCHRYPFLGKDSEINLLEWPFKVNHLQDMGTAICVMERVPLKYLTPVIVNMILRLYPLC